MVTLRHADRGRERRHTTQKISTLLCAKQAGTGDHVTRELFEHILVDEERHVDWLEAQLNLIKDIGRENYLTQQIRKDE